MRSGARDVTDLYLYSDSHSVDVGTVGGRYLENAPYLLMIDSETQHASESASAHISNPLEKWSTLARQSATQRRPKRWAWRTRACFIRGPPAIAATKPISMFTDAISCVQPVLRTRNSSLLFDNHPHQRQARSCNNLPQIR